MASHIFGLVVAILFTVLITEAAFTGPRTMMETDNISLIGGKWLNRDGELHSNSESNITEPDAPKPDEQFFDQCLDHFAPNGCNTLWKQRFWVRNDLYQPGGPVFFQFGGERNAENYTNSYYWQTYAKNLNATLIVLEHRFYGKSWPTKSSISDPPLKSIPLLTSQQALADAEYFIRDYKQKNTILGNASWVAFGGSYAGNLAAWMRQKYPDVVKAAVASSAPLEAVYHFPGYIETISSVIKETNPECFSKIHAAFQCMENFVNGVGCAGFTNASDILSALRLNNSVNFTDQPSRETFFFNLTFGMWASNSSLAKINCACANLNNVTAGANPLENYGNFMAQMGKEGGKCVSQFNMELNEQEIWDFIDTEEGSQEEANSWLWQTCNEFGYFFSSDPKHGLFGKATFSSWLFESLCNSQYNLTAKELESRINQTNQHYKGKGIDDSCIVFFNGGRDPWHSLSVLNSSNSSSPRKNTVEFILEAEHCEDMMPNNKTENVRKAQERIQKQIISYINNPDC